MNLSTAISLRGIPAKFNLFLVSQSNFDSTTKQPVNDKCSDFLQQNALLHIFQPKSVPQIYSCKYYAFIIAKQPGILPVLHTGAQKNGC